MARAHGMPKLGEEYARYAAATERVEAAAQTMQSSACLLEFATARLDFLEPLADEPSRVAARNPAVVTNGDYLADLPEGQTRAVSVADERDAVDDVIGVVAATAVGAASAPMSTNGTFVGSP